MSSFDKELPKEKIAAILQKIEGQAKVEVIETEVSPGTEKGDNFSGLVLAVDAKAKVDGVAKEYHWMVKLPVPDPSRRALVRGMRAELKEFLVYSELIPAWQRLIDERKARIELNFCPSPFTEFHEDIDKGSIIVMENMKFMNYRDAIDKRKGLSIHYVKLALTELAKFHALGYAYIKSYPGGIQEGLAKNDVVARDFFFSATNRDEAVEVMLNHMQGSMIPNMINVLSACEEPGQNFGDALLRFHERKNIFQLRDELFASNPDEFNTLCHGDAWFNNMLFHHVKQEDGSLHPDKACLLDLAISRWANPCTDLGYFLYLSTTPEIRRTHMEAILGHYHDSLIRFLHDLGEDPAVYPYRQLVKDFKKYKVVGLVMALWILPNLFCKKEDAIGAEEMDGLDFNNPEQMKQFMDKLQLHMQKAFQNEPRIKIILGGTFLEFLTEGYFDE